MKQPYSKSGLALSAIYILFTIYMVITAFTCTGMFCGIVIIFPTLPWFYLWEPLMLLFPSHLEAFAFFSFLTLSVALNILALYYIGKGVGKMFSYKPYR